jgi:hypothetical protein
MLRGAQTRGAQWAAAEAREAAAASAARARAGPAAADARAGDGEMHAALRAKGDLRRRAWQGEAAGERTKRKQLELHQARLAWRASDYFD